MGDTSKNVDARTQELSQKSDDELRQMAQQKGVQASGSGKDLARKIAESESNQGQSQGQQGTSTTK